MIHAFAAARQRPFLAVGCGLLAAPLVMVDRHIKSVQQPVEGALRFVQLLLERLARKIRAAIASPRATELLAGLDQVFGPTAGP